MKYKCSIVVMILFIGNYNHAENVDFETSFFKINKKVEYFETRYVLGWSNSFILLDEIYDDESKMLGWANKFLDFYILKLKNDYPLVKLRNYSFYIYKNTATLNSNTIFKDDGNPYLEKYDNDLLMLITYNKNEEKQVRKKNERVIHFYENGKMTKFYPNEEPAFYPPSK